MDSHYVPRRGHNRGRNNRRRNNQKNVQAYALAVRKNPRNRAEWQVLIAQKHIVDFEHTLGRNHLNICNNPGDFVIPGGREESEDEGIRARSALREFCEETKLFQDNEELDSFLKESQEKWNLTLSHTIFKGKTNSVLAQFFLMREEENSWMPLYKDNEIDKKNTEFEELEKILNYEKHGPITSEKEPIDYTELHKLGWYSLEDALNLFENDNLWKNNEWRNQEKFNVLKKIKDYASFPQDSQHRKLRQRLENLQEDPEPRQEVDWFIHAIEAAQKELENDGNSNSNSNNNNDDDNNNNDDNNNTSKELGNMGAVQIVFPHHGSSKLNHALSKEPVLLNGMKVLFDEPAPVYPVNVVRKNQED